MDDVTILHGDCLEILPTLEAGSVDAIITDPPYPEIDREYGRLTEAEWHDMMHIVVIECRRVLKPSGSAVFILQPNYERIGRTRPWFWEFVAWAAREWNLIEDVYWWNTTALPNAGCERRNGLLRRSVKPCVWLGDPECYRDQDAVLWSESEWNTEARARKRAAREMSKSGNGRDRVGIASVSAERGGVTPFNLIPIAASGNPDDQGYDHPSPTPLDVVDWWIRYLSRPDDVILDPFVGGGTTLVAAYQRRRRAIGIEQNLAYFLAIDRRLKTVELPLFQGLGVDILGE